MIEKIKKILNQILSVICAALLAFMSLLTCYQVFMRYVIKSPSTMSEDILSYSFVWISLLATALVFGERDHMNLTFFVGKMNKKMQKVIAVFSEVLILVIAILVFLYGGKGLLAVGALQVSPTLGISMNIIYSVIPISGVIIVAYAIINIIQIIADGSEDKEVEK